MGRKQLDYRALNNKVCKDADEFVGAMLALFDVATTDVDWAVRTFILELSTRLIVRTPVDTGRTKMGWNIDELPSEWIPPVGEYQEEEVIQAINKTIAELPMHSKITLSNNIDYLLVLEAGHSWQAPSGFINLALQEMKIALETEADRWSKMKA